MYAPHSASPPRNDCQSGETPWMEKIPHPDITSSPGTYVVGRYRSLSIAIIPSNTFLRFTLFNAFEQWVPFSSARLESLDSFCLFIFMNMNNILLPVLSPEYFVFAPCKAFKRQCRHANYFCLFEPRNDKTNKLSVRPAKTQISLGISPVWSESSLCAEWVATDPRFLHADNEDSDQTGRMPRLIWVFAGRTFTLLVLSCRGSF